MQAVPPAPRGRPSCLQWLKEQGQCWDLLPGATVGQPAAGVMCLSLGWFRSVFPTLAKDPNVSTVE